MRQIVQANSASPHFANAAITSAKGKEPVESPPTVSRKQLAAESDSDLIITFTSSDAEEEEYSETDIFGRDYSSSDNDTAEHATTLNPPTMRSRRPLSRRHDCGLLGDERHA